MPPHTVKRGVAWPADVVRVDKTVDSLQKKKEIEELGKRGPSQQA